MNPAPAPPPLWFCNGELRETNSPVLSLAEIGSLNGAGVFETIPLFGSIPFALEDHFERLEQGADRFGLPCPSLDELRERIERLAKRYSREPGMRARVRVTLIESTHAGSGAHEIIEIGPPPSHPPAASAITLPFARNDRGALAGIKTISYGENAVALRHVALRGGTEGIFLNTRGLLCEGIWTNVFVRIGEQWRTPPLSSGCLPGITRKHILAIADSIQEMDVPEGEIERVESAFLTSSLRGIQPVESLDGRALSSPEDPEVRKWRDAYRERVRQLTKD